MGQARNWSKEEFDYLESNWGVVSIPTIAKKLDRSVNAVKIKAGRRGLGCHLHSGDFITAHQFFLALGISYGESVRKLVKYNFPFIYRKSVNQKYRAVRIEDFWKWAEANKRHIDFAKFEWGMLGKEPCWVAEKRKIDQINRLYGHARSDKWTPLEDQLLITMLKQYRYTYTDISKRLRRTEAALKRRFITQGIKMRPITAHKHEKWTSEQEAIVLEMHQKGYCPDAIADKLHNKSALAVMGKLERMLCKC